MVQNGIPIFCSIKKITKILAIDVFCTGAHLVLLSANQNITELCLEHKELRSVGIFELSIRLVEITSDKSFSIFKVTTVNDNSVMP
jgi:hypothetical protein